MMQQVIVPERNGAREHARHVQQDAEDLVERRATKHQVVRALVDDDVELVTQESSNGVSRSERQPQRRARYRRGKPKLYCNVDSAYQSHLHAGSEELYYIW